MPRVTVDMTEPRTVDAGEEVAGSGKSPKNGWFSFWIHYFRRFEEQRSLASKCPEPFGKIKPNKNCRLCGLPKRIHGDD